MGQSVSATKSETLMQVWAGTEGKFSIKRACYCYQVMCVPLRPKSVL